MPNVSAEVLERICVVLSEHSNQYYNDFNGPHGYECKSCLAESRDGKSSPPHSDDCEAINLMTIIRAAIDQEVDDEVDCFMTGKKVQKKSGKPFKSGNKINTVKGERTNPQCPKGRLAFTFYEDDSCVNQELCEEALP